MPSGAASSPLSVSMWIAEAGAVRMSGSGLGGAGTAASAGMNGDGVALGDRDVGVGVGLEHRRRPRRPRRAARRACAFERSWNARTVATSSLWRASAISAAGSITGPAAVRRTRRRPRARASARPSARPRCARRRGGRRRAARRCRGRSPRAARRRRPRPDRRSRPARAAGAGRRARAAGPRRARSAGGSRARGGSPFQVAIIRQPVGGRGLLAVERDRHAREEARERAAAPRPGRLWSSSSTITQRPREAASTTRSSAGAPVTTVAPRALPACAAARVIGEREPRLARRRARPSAAGACRR